MNEHDVDMDEDDDVVDKVLYSKTLNDSSSRPAGGRRTDELEHEQAQRLIHHCNSFNTEAEPTTKKP